MQFIIPALILITLSPFLWLYEQIGPEWFWSIPAVGIVIRQWRHQAIRKHRALEKVLQEEALKVRKAKEQREFAEQIGRRALEKQLEREQRQQQPNQVKVNNNAIELRPNKNRVHTRETNDGFLEVAWREQMEEVKRAWKNGDFDFARTWLQKMAYSLTTTKAPEAVHDKFKALMVAFTRDDPLYADILSQVLPTVEASPGIIQSELAKHFSDYDTEHFRYVLYFAAESGDIIRIKKGRSYQLFPPVTETVVQSTPIGNTGLVASVIFREDPVDAHIAALHREATEHKNVNWDEAIRCLTEANALTRQRYGHCGIERGLRLPLFLQQAGRFKEVMNEFETLLNEVKPSVHQDFSHCSPLVKERIIHAGYQQIYDKMRLACKRQKLPDEAKRYQLLAEEHKEKLEELNALSEYERNRP